MTPREAAQWTLTEEINSYGVPLDWRAVDRVVKKVMVVSGCSFDTAKGAMKALFRENPSYLAYNKPKVVKVKKRAPKKKAKRKRKTS